MFIFGCFLQTNGFVSYTVAIFTLRLKRLCFFPRLKLSFFFLHVSLFLSLFFLFSFYVAQRYFRVLIYAVFSSCTWHESDSVATLMKMLLIINKPGNHFFTCRLVLEEQAHLSMVPGRVDHRFKSISLCIAYAL